MKALKNILSILVVASALLVTGCHPEETGNESSDTPTGNVVIPSNEVSDTELVIYPGPSEVKEDERVDVKVDDKDLFVYQTRVNHRRIFTYDYSTDTAPLAIFDFQGLVHVSLTFNEVDTITTYKISPADYSIEAEIVGNTLKFDLYTPTNYVVEVNGDYKSAVHLFCSLPEEDPITEEEAESDDNILYFGPGVYKVDSLPIKEGMTIYLAGGSYVYGQALTADLNGVTIKGRGIISGEIYDRRSAAEKMIPVELQRCSNVRIEGVTILDPAGWAVALIDCTDVVIDDLKIISARANSDGISLQSCHNVNVKGGFVRSWDDSLVVKNVNRGTTENITFDGTSVWTDLAQSMEVGYETNGPTMSDITFKNITVIHNFHKAAMSIHNCDDASINGVSFENITIEDGRMLGDDQNDGINDFLIDMTIAYNAEWTKSEGKRGKISDVTFKDIRVDHLEDTILSRINGESAESSVENVTFENINIENETIENADSLNLTTNQYVSGIEFKKTKALAGAILTLPYKNTSNGDNPTITEISKNEKTGILVPEFLHNKNDTAYIGEKSEIEPEEIKVTHGVGTTSTADYDDGSGLYNKTETSNAMDSDRSTLLEFKDFTGAANEFLALTVTFKDVLNIGVLRFLGDLNNETYSRYQIALYARRLKSDGTPNDNFVRILSSNTYELSPAKGNYFDINFTPTSYKAIQLRFYKNDSIGYNNSIRVGELEFYQPSLTYNKPIVYSTEHNDVYNVERIVDGQADGTSYYESKTLPAVIVIDLKAIYTIQTMVMFLPSQLSWTTRIQNIEILTSNSQNDFDNSTTEFETLVEAKDYTFDPEQGNRNVIDVSAKSVQARFIKIVINSNNANGGYGGQLSEFNAYGR